MKYGFILPFGDARVAADLARDAEQAGWDGFFLWEPICGVDAWIGLTPRQLHPHEYHELFAYGIGLTDLAKHHAGMDSDIPKHGFDPAAFQAKMQQYHPQAVAFTSKKTGQVYFKHPVTYGIQGESIGAIRLYVLPSPSPAARGSWEISYWQALADFVHAP